MRNPKTHSSVEAERALRACLKSVEALFRHAIEKIRACLKSVEAEGQLVDGRFTEE